jgi:hypothetical protein
MLLYKRKILNLLFLGKFLEENHHLGGERDQLAAAMEGEILSIDLYTPNTADPLSATVGTNN